MTKKKRIGATVAAMALSAAVAVGGTFAYLQAVTETKKNVFTSSKNVSTKLTETEWNENSGSDYTPGKVISKNPVMSNDSSENQSIYVAVKVDYIGSDNGMISYDNFKKYAQVYTSTEANTDTYNAKWTKLSTNTDGSEIWVYNTALAKGESTEAIFDGVKVNAGIKEEWTQKSKTTKTYVVDENGNKTLVDTQTATFDPTVKYIDENGNTVDAGVLPQFSVDVTGFAIQADGFTVDTASVELKSLVNSKTTTKFN